MRGMGQTGDQVQGRRTDEYGNPISETGGGFPTDAGGNGGGDTTGAFPADIGATTGHGMTGTHAPDIGAGYAGSGTQGQLHRGGGGVTEKIKEKLPGGHKDEQRTSTGAYEGEHEKKGMMEKIKEKLPGRNN